MLEDDYITRMIKDMVKAIVKAILGKSELNYELPKENERTDNDMLFDKLTKLADEGKINEAENLLFTKLEFKEPKELEIAMAFYLHINEYEEDFLESANYSRNEISEGIEAIAKKYGYSGIMNVFNNLQR
ncbi:hypothetical protein C8E03_105200 [Lachnotalea glycerini]|jgi:hypothetical protein|uniref:Uncharacterized protein n=1 Tax=Lachnotalea glycerini TaxID=1763509 RepID=A0A255IDE1_9FIRM|nr:DUF6483 family protein [Lachnotalea glycerini]OYP47240.1 hypothetical protein CG709_03405 [Lachnotalea glycerini]PXV90290.1 hypothetical protein C8E03_105200 [Lachnotalea glycerini]RDY31043.1 hypothetical protein CG710_011730 [Lachnotalea glycerini]